MPTRIPKKTPNTEQPTSPPAVAAATDPATEQPTSPPAVAATPDPATALATPDTEVTPKPIPLADAIATAAITNGNYTLKQILANPWLRITHLYYVKDKDGHRVKFNPWPEQKELYQGMHYLNLILKARQRGMTTFIQIFMLDACLFNDNINAGVIAHNREDAQKFFDDKIKFAYDNLPDVIKRSRTAPSDNKNELKFINGSSIRVGTSMRSGTLQYLHISEYGKICAKYPDKAKEIRAGGLNTVASGNIIFIESTAEGAYGDFHGKCKDAENLQLSGEPLTQMDYKFFFFPWWRASEYVLNERVRLTDEDTEYFRELHKDHGVDLTEAQKAWYVKKKKEQGDNVMTQEYPSTPEEAFRGTVDGAVYGKQMRLVRKERRITHVPYNPGTPVNTFWDIGRDMTSIWFHQRIGGQNRFIYYYQEPNQSLEYFVKLLLQDIAHPFHKYRYGKHYFPHDMGEIEYVQGEQKKRIEWARSLGLQPCTALDRVRILEEGIEMTRQVFESCVFDKDNCELGISALENYRYEKDDKLDVYKKEPVHNWASHPADAFRQFAQGYRHRAYSNADDTENPLSRAGRRKTRKDESDWRI